MVVVGLTGGIGSGKTTVAHLFEKLGVPIIDADEIAHRLTRPNEIAYDDIIKHFGVCILNDDKTINRKKLSVIIFENPAEKKWLENLLHPLIRAKMKNAIQKIKSPYCICVIPLLTESSGIDFIDRVLVVDSSPEQQLLRAAKRDQVSAERVQKIMDLQANKTARLAIADDVLMNDGDLAALEKKVMALHQQYLLLKST